MLTAEKFLMLGKMPFFARNAERDGKAKEQRKREENRRRVTDEIQK